jgi:hypothetical protein
MKHIKLNWVQSINASAGEIEKFAAWLAAEASAETTNEKETTSHIRLTDQSLVR